MDDSKKLPKLTNEQITRFYNLPAPQISSPPPSPPKEPPPKERKKILSAPVEVIHPTIPGASAIMNEYGDILDDPEGYARAFRDDKDPILARAHAERSQYKKENDIADVEPIGGRTGNDYTTTSPITPESIQAYHRQVTWQHPAIRSALGSSGLHGIS